MGQDMFLTDDEIIRLTGKTRWSAQCRELQNRGWVLDVQTSGRPVVSRAHAEAKLGGGWGKIPSEPSHKKWTPDFSRLKETEVA